MKLWKGQQFKFYTNNRHNDPTKFAQREGDDRSLCDILFSPRTH